MDFRITIEVDVMADDHEQANVLGHDIASDLINLGSVLSVHCAVDQDALKQGQYLHDRLDAEDAGHSVRVPLGDISQLP